MKICPQCGFYNQNKKIRCKNCDSDLPDTSTYSPDFSEMPAALDRVESVPFHERRHIVLHVSGTPFPLHLHPDPDAVIGRIDPDLPPESTPLPDLDLAPYGAYEKGVSKIHAVITRNGDALTVMDLESSNGTYLNGRLLRPNVAYSIRDGDQLAFGKMVARIFFTVHETDDLKQL